VGLALGRTLDHVVLHEAGRSMGQTAWLPEKDGITPAVAAATALGGTLAEHLLLPEPDRHWTTVGQDDGDIQMMMLIAAETPVRTYEEAGYLLEEGRRLAERALRANGNLARRIATALDERGRLTSDQVKALGVAETNDDDG
jgi:hypothetical protein